MIRMEKSIIVGLFSVLLILSCKINENEETIEAYVKGVDKIKKVEKLYEIELDSLGMIIDTLSLKTNKVNNKGELIFQERKINTNKGVIKRTDYYKKKELIFSKSESSNLGVLSVFKFINLNDDFRRAISVQYNEGIPKDTILMEYKYSYKEDKLKHLNITANLNKNFSSKTEIDYIEKDMPVKELSILNGDTISLQKYIYRNRLLKSKSLINYQKGLIFLYKYDDKGCISNEKISSLSDSSIVINETVYTVNDKGDIFKSIKVK